jgi:hypothetical protein
MTKSVWFLTYLLATVSVVSAQTGTKHSAPRATAECSDRSGWRATTWPVLVADGKHYLRVLHIYADGAGESHGREALLPTEAVAATGSSFKRLRT